MLYRTHHAGDDVSNERLIFAGKATVWVFAVAALVYVLARITGLISEWFGLYE